MFNCPKCNSAEHIIGIEYAVDEVPHHYDGISEWQCQKCGTRVGRWTKKILSDSEREMPYGITK